MNKINLIRLMHMAESNYSRKWRLKFHLTSKTGCLGNACVVFSGGEYHIFYRYSPFDTASDADFWGHFITNDFINYMRSDPVLCADSSLDCNGLLSGSAIIGNCSLDIFYGGIVQHGKNILEKNIILLENEEKTLILKASDYPENTVFVSANPKVWKENDEYFMLLGIGNNENSGEALLYKSTDKYNWNLKNIISPPEKLGDAWETADYFILDGIKFISVSLLSKKSGYIPLEGDIDSGYRLADFHEFDYGFDFYAPTVFTDDKDRLLLIAHMGQSADPTKSCGWLNSLTIPRIITQRNGKIFQAPADELSLLRKNETFAEFDGEETFSDFTVFDCFITGENLHIIIRKSLEIHCNNDEITIEFINNGYGRTAKTIPSPTINNLRILADESSVEIFISDGEITFTSRFYPKQEEKGIFIEGKNVSVSLWEMNEFNYSGNYMK